MKKLCASAVREGYSDLLVINEGRRKPDGLVLVHLPDGPTAHFRLSNVKITTELRRNHRDINAERPEVVLQNFTTRLGLSVGRMLGAIFHQEPEFVGRRCVAFHNQRDYIFFRHYKYQFDENGKRTKLRELGPRFTLRLRSLQKGTFDSKEGSFMWNIEGRRHDIESSRRRFCL